MILFTLKLIIAHVIGDFVLQPNSWVAAKKKDTYKSKYFYFHGLVHLVALFVLLGFDFSYTLAIVFIISSHLLIDWVKLTIENKKNSRSLFVIDQLAHLVIIAIITYVYFPYKIDFEYLYNIKFLLFSLALLILSFMSSVLMKLIMSRWVLEEDKSEDSLENAGKYIGVLERLFVFGFILLNQWSAIGLLIAAKSVFRFGDLSRAKDRKLTEYILIGTLLSFGFAILVGLLYQYFIKTF